MLKWDERILAFRASLSADGCKDWLHVNRLQALLRTYRTAVTKRGSSYPPGYHCSPAPQNFIRGDTRHSWISMVTSRCAERRVLCIASLTFHSPHWGAGIRLLGTSPSRLPLTLPHVQLFRLRTNGELFSLTTQRDSPARDSCGPTSPTDASTHQPPSLTLRLDIGGIQKQCRVSSHL